MSDQMTWHIPGDLLARYLTSGLDPVRAISVDAHLAKCARCRAAVPSDQAWLAESRAAIADIVDRPKLTLLERVLMRMGMPDHLSRLLAATPTLSRSWLMAVVSVLSFAVVATRLWSDHAEGLVLFLVIAPVLPLGGIAIAYGRHVDPAYELLTATPMAGPRLLLIRACAVLVTAIALTGAATPLIPGMTVTWLLPALSLAAGCLVLSVRMPMPVAAAVLAGAWLGAVFTIGGLNGDVFTVFRPPAQALYGFATPILALIMFARLHRLDPGEPR
ncbi:zf-HC2 domain-containing protein [Streptosporangium sp. CA-135522]|uniref:zf-HC2 domain-containing protein n=1 Tax=Streptosporangium sp. CA-135522 TaxID=3240072 RepID=UPI003D919519